MKKYLAFASVAAVAVALLSSCGKKKDYQPAISGSEIIAVDESFQNVMEQVIPVFEFQYPDAAILARYLPEDDCIDSLMQRNVNLAVVTRQLNEVERNLMEKQGRPFREQMIAVDAVAILANKENTIDALSVYDLTKILRGEVTDWSEIDKGNRSGKITVVFDFQGSSTINYLSQTLLDGAYIEGNVYAQNSNAKVFEAVQRIPGAIGVVGVSWVSADMSKANMSAEELYADAQQDDDVMSTTFDDSVRVLPIVPLNEINGVQPYQAFIYDGQYPLVRKVFMIVTGYTGSLQQAFFNFVTSFAGQKLMATTGVLPGNIQPRIVQVE